ncbi:MAG: glutathione transporter substrate-binding protein [Bacillota bacterium]|jgi:peptide/nickel transport system substrate-binding protein|nr:glutathione transporter substrate-binding protein [Bacillota bacterium]
MKSKMKAILSMLLVTAMLTVGCSGGSSESSNTPAKVTGSTAKTDLIIANTAGEPGNLHPFNTVSIGRVICTDGIYESLLTLNDKSEIVGKLAESYEQSNTEITFHLRKGVKFHNGVEMKAKDVVFSLQEVMLHSTGGLATFFDSVDASNIKAVDDYTVKVPLKQVDTTILSNIVNNFFVLPSDAYHQMGDDFQYKPIGTGPFKFKEWVVGDHITLEKFNDYWGGTAKLNTVTIRTIPEVAQAMVEVETGGADIMTNPLGSDVNKVLNGEVKGIKAFTKESLVLRNNNVNLNWNSEYIKNQKVREVIARSIDRDSWVNIISPGVGVPTYSNIAAGVWGYDESISKSYPYTYDLEKAKELMKEAGYGSGITLVLLTDSRAYHLQAVELLQNTLSQIGINLEVKTMELAQQKEMMSTGEGFDLYMLDNLFNSADPLSGLWRDSHPMFAKVNSSHYHFYTVNDAQGAKYQDLLNKIRITVDDNERLNYTKELQKIFVEDIIWIPINSIQGYCLGNEKLQNVSFLNDIIMLTNETSFVN